MFFVHVALSEGDKTAKVAFWTKRGCTAKLLAAAELLFGPPSSALGFWRNHCSQCFDISVYLCVAISSVWSHPKAAGSCFEMQSCVIRFYLEVAMVNETQSLPT